MKLGILIATIMDKINDLMHVSGGSPVGFTPVNGDVNKYFKAASPIGPDDGVIKSVALNYISTNRPEVIPTSGDPVMASDPENNEDAVNVRYLQNILLEYANINGDPTKRFKLADAVDLDEGVSLAQVTLMSENASSLSIGDTISTSSVTANPDSFIDYFSSNRTENIVDYQELVDSNAECVTDVNTTAGTFTFVGHNGFITSPDFVTKIKVK